MIKPYIYMAGKVYKNCWRHDIVVSLRGFLESEDYKKDDFPILEAEDFYYTGPFFVSCDHGCYHAENSHGMGLDIIGFQHKPDLIECAGIDIFDGENSYDYVQNRCFNGIKNSQVVYAWLNSEDSFGTFAELGYAKAMGKKIWIASPKINEDMWFLYKLADSFIIDDDPTNAFKKLLSASRNDLTYMPY